MSRYLSIFGAFSLMLAVCLLALELDPGYPAPRITVRWAPDVTDASRIWIERAREFRVPLHREGRTWSYALLNESPGNIARLLDDPRIADTHLIDRKTFTVFPDAPRGPNRTRHINRIPIFHYLGPLLPQLIGVSVALGVIGFLATLRGRLSCDWRRGLHGAWRRIRTRQFAGGAAAVLLLCMLAVQVDPGRPAPNIRIRWIPGAEGEQRVELERAFHLIDAESLGRRTWSYQLMDDSRENIAAILTHPLIEDTAQ